MCKGTVKEKAPLFFEVIVGPENVKQGDTDVSWTSGRMKAAFKKLFFFSEIFPKKYQTEFVAELLEKHRASIKVKGSAVN